MAGQNMDQFEAYFQRADLDRDGRITGAEAVGFFQASNLPKPVLAQIWMYADHNKTGFLGRQEFYNALKLVTVAQSKRELTPDIVKAALHGPASAKIPAPQINLAALPGPQSNVRAGSPVPPLSSPTPLPPQSTGIRGPQGFPSQQSQFMRPPRPPPASIALQSQQVVASQGMPQGGSIAAPIPSSSDWLGGRTSSSPSQSGTTSQFPDRGMGSTTGLVASGSAPSTQPRPQATALLTQPVPSKPNDTNPSNQVAAKDSKALAVTGNGFASDSLFGDVFSETSSQPKQDSVGLTSFSSSLPVSSAIVPTSVGTQPAVKPGPINPSQRSLTQHQQGQLKVEPNQHVQTSAAVAIGTGNSVSGQSQLPWPKMTQSDVQKYSKVFFQVDTDRDGKITGEQARNLFLSWRLPREILKQVWDLSDQDNDSMLSLREFCVALYLMERSREGRPLPSVLPTSVILDETLLPSSGPPAMPYGNASLRPTGFQQPQVTKGARPVTSVGGGKPPRPPQLEEPTPPSQPKPKVPVLEKHLLEQLSTEEQNALNLKFQEATDAEKKVAELEKEIMDAKEKIQFYHAKMQELILYKSRCDNRLNEITARVSADKQEAELLAKKYEEKYKQVGDVASKLSIEEATFRDIQEKKMELYRAIVKLDQDGSADKIQDHANRIQLDLEGQVKALNERCKTYGLRGKPTSLLELPFGWQLGIQEGAADWDEDWDKFEDEGFTFVKELTLDVQNVIAPPKSKTSIRDKASSTDDSKVKESSSNGDVKAEKFVDAEKRIPEDEGAIAQGEEQRAGSPLDSPARSNAVQSSSKAFQDSQSRKDVSFDGSPRATQSEHEGAKSVLSGDKAFDEAGWGSFDTQFDTDAAWDFNPTSTKDSDPEGHDENSLFGPNEWGLNPIKTGSTRDNTYPKQSPFFDSVPSTPITYANFDSVPSTPNTYVKQSTFFDSVPSTPNTYVKQSTFFDSVPSTPLYNSGSSPHADNMFQRKSPFSFADSVPGTPMFNSGNSPRRFSEGSQEHSFDTFSRFDSFNMHDSGPFTPGESFTRFDSMSSTRDSDYDQGLFSTRESLSRFDSFRSTADSEYNHGLFPPRESLTRFDSMRSTKDTDFGHGFPSFDDADPFGSSEPFKSSLESQTPRSSEPFKTSLESQTPRRDSGNWKAF